MQSDSSPRTTLAIFCKVVDNFGDIGICWRLARQLHGEHGIDVTLWVDDLASFRRIWPSVDADAALQTVDGVTVRHWASQDGAFEAHDIPDIVVEFFGVELPPAYVAAMARRTPRPAWINYEGLSAESWVEGCHALPSMHPRLKLTKHFFFPGFTNKTGGLLRERHLLEARAAFQADRSAKAGFLRGLGVDEGVLDTLCVSLFCYPDARVSDLFAAWEAGGRTVTCLVPEGVARAQVAAFLGVDEDAVRPGARAARGRLTVQVVPFMRQDDYDRLLWTCDVNFVRGEDSWVRAQWAGRPFVWHIYPQDELLHHVKLRAFLQAYAGNLAGLADFSLAWNGAGTRSVGWPALWAALEADLPAIARRADDWQNRMSANGDLVGNLLQLTRSLG